MKSWVLLSVFVLCYATLVPPFFGSLQGRPSAVKLGPPPNAKILRAASGEFAPLYAECQIVKVLFYFGTLIEELKENVIIQPEFFNMFKTMESSVILDPYNMDAYYFSQAAFTWELGRAADVNSLLDYGMKYRNWDYWLPFYAGFNSAYFLKDYQSAADYMKRAAEISGDPLFTKLAARYFYEAGRADLGMVFLDTMISGAKDDAVKISYQMRKEALSAVKVIEAALKRYQGDFAGSTVSLKTLVLEGYLSRIPDDPYGGNFYIDSAGRVRSTSKFSLKRSDKNIIPGGEYNDSNPSQ